MSNKFEECILLPIEDETLMDVVKNVRDWAPLHGMSVRKPHHYEPDYISYAPFTLTPSSWPRSLFAEAANVQRILNSLIHHVALDKEFLNTVLSDVSKVDPFVGKLYAIYRRLLNEDRVQPIEMAIIRSDIMLEQRGRDENDKPCEYCTWKQVELHTMAVKYGHYGPLCKALHEYVLQELGRGEKIRNLPVNKALHSISNGLAKAWDLYKNTAAVIMIVVEDEPYDISEERFHEFYVRKHNPEIGVIRRTLAQVANSCRLTDEKALMVGRYEVAVVYFRTGHDPSNYISQMIWDTRYMIESSKAIKCPTLHYQLASSKKVLQVLTQPGMVERFLKDGDEVQKIRKMFANIYELSDSEVGHANYRMAMDHPERYVLKPNREGSDQYAYGAEIQDLLKRKSEKERAAWIMMDRIQAPAEKTYVIRPGGKVPPEPVKIISTLGIFGLIIATPDEILSNMQIGHVLRSRQVAADTESGVAAGTPVLNSVFLVD